MKIIITSYKLGIVQDPVPYSFGLRLAFFSFEKSCLVLTRMNLSGEITGRHVPGDELVGDADDVAEVGGQLEAEHSKLRESKSY